MCRPPHDPHASKPDSLKSDAVLARAMQMSQSMRRRTDGSDGTSCVVPRSDARANPAGKAIQ